MHSANVFELTQHFGRILAIEPVGIFQVQQHRVGACRIGILCANPKTLGDPSPAFFDDTNRRTIPHLNLLQLLQRPIVDVQHNRLPVVCQQFDFELFSLRVHCDDSFRYEIESILLHTALRTDLNQLRRNFICHDLYPLRRTKNYDFSRQPRLASTPSTVSCTIVFSSSSSASRGSIACFAPSRASDSAAFLRTSQSSSLSDSINGDTPRASPILPKASAAWRRTIQLLPINPSIKASTARVSPIFFSTRATSSRTVLSVSASTNPGTARASPIRS